MYACMMYVCMYICMWIYVCIYLCTYVMYFRHFWTVARDVPSRYFEYCRQHRRVHYCGSGNCWPVNLSLMRECATEKNGYKIYWTFSSYFGRSPQSFYIITETKDGLFYMRRTSVSYCIRIIYCTIFLRFHFMCIVWIFENQVWRSCSQRNVTGLLKWTGWLFMEPYILLQLASSIQSFPSLIQMLMFLGLCLCLL